MKICPLCNTTYEDWIDFCFSDGMPLVATGGASSPLPVTTAPPAPKAAVQLTEAAELPSASEPPEAPAAAVGHGDEAPGRPEPAAPPSDITGIFTGNIFDDDGEEFRRPAPVLAPVPAEQQAETAAPAAPTAPSEAPEPAPTSVNASDVAELFAAFDAATSASPAAPDAIDDDEPPAPPEKKSRMGMVFGGMALSAVVLAGVIGVGMMGGKPAPVVAPEAPVAAAVVAPEAPVPVAPVEPAVAPVEPPVEPPAAPVEPPVVAAPAPPVAPPVPAKPAAPAVAPPVPAKPGTPAAAPVNRVAVAAPAPKAVQPAQAAPSSNISSDDANPWGAPAAVTSGTLKIVTDPDGATVYVNDKQRGKTPLTVELPYGLQNIRVVRGGYKTEVRDVNIGVPSLTVPFTLKPELVTGAVNVYGPAGYHVLVDGFDRGPMPVTVQVNEGVRQFKLVSDTNGGNCSLPKEIKFRTPGRPETVTLSCP